MSPEEKLDRPGKRIYTESIKIFFQYMSIVCTGYFCEKEWCIF